MKIFIYINNDTLSYTTDEKKIICADTIYLIKNNEDIGEFLLDEFEKDRFNIDILIEIANKVKDELKNLNKENEM